MERKSALVVFTWLSQSGWESRTYHTSLLLLMYYVFLSLPVSPVPLYKSLYLSVCHLLYYYFFFLSGFV